MTRRVQRVGEQRFGHHDCPRELIFGAAAAVNAVDPQTGEA
jgi:hypothetical protein